MHLRRAALLITENVNVAERQMTQCRLFTLLMIIVLISLGLTGALFAAAADTHAHPAYGFTPTPTSQPPGDNGDDGDTDSPSDDGASPIDYVWVQIDRCDLDCLIEVEFAQAAPAAGLLDWAGVESAVVADPPEMLIEVDMVHQGSGWIARGTLSNQRPTRVSVPYPGRWEIFLVSNPSFVTANAIDPGGTNLPQIQADLAVAAIPLGVVDANSAAVQLVKCPVICLIEPPPEPVESQLPVTGSNGVLLALHLIFGAAYVSLTLGLAMWLKQLHTSSLLLYENTSRPRFQPLLARKNTKKKE
jgi:hypothetical protein